MSAPTQKIFVELDCILDTRLGTIARINEQAAIDILNNNYHSRDTDDFSQYIDNEKFKELYEDRDGITLEYSSATSCLHLIETMCRELLVNTAVNPNHSGAELVINLYPYVMENHVIETLINAIRIWIGTNVIITTVNLAPEYISAIYCKNNISTMFMYNYERWLNKHIESFKDVNLKEMTMYVPAIYHNKKPTSEEMESLLAKGPHPFIELELLLKPVLDFNIIDIRIFSVVKPDDLPRFTEFVSNHLKYN